MNVTRNHQFLLAVVALAWSGFAFGQAAVKPPVADKTSPEVFTGAWVRPDGGYVILVKSVGPDGRLQAMYFNPNPLPFAKAQVSREGGKLRAFFELQAGGYAGSTYTLTYDPAADRLTGTYYQAVAKQSFDVVFSRK